MRFRFPGPWLGLCALALALTGGTRLRAQEPEPPVNNPPKNAPLYVPNEVLVTFKPGVRISAALQSVQRLGLAVAKDSDSPFFAKLEIPARLRAQGATVPSAIEALRKDPTVQAADPNYYVYPAFRPNDPRWLEQWGPLQVGCEAAWEITRGNANLRVAVLDSGVDYNHPDLTPNLAKDAIGGVIGYDYAENDLDPMDDPVTDPEVSNGHGTHVAGIIGAVGSNNTGVSGVSPNVRIVPVRVIGDDGTGTEEWWIRGLDFARSKGCRIANLSLGSLRPGTAAGQAAMHRAVNAGMVVLCAAGNGHEDAVGDNNDRYSFHPANYEGCISVAATDTSDALTRFSNFGATTVDLAAPGDSILSTLPGGSYGVMSGTSQATPITAGAAALLLSQQPRLTPAEVRARLIDLCVSVTALRGRMVSGGRLSALNLVGDGYESDDSRATARDYGTDPQLHGFHTPTDADWVKFTLTEPADVYITAARSSNLSREVDMELALYKHDGSDPLEADRGGPGGIARERSTRLVQGTYYVRCSALGQVHPGYRLVITVRTAAKDKYEPDDVFGDASEIKNGETQTRRIEAPRGGDWIFFEVVKLSDVVIETAGPDRNAGISIALFGRDPRSQSMGSVDTGGYSRMDRTGDAALPPGRYYILTEESGRDAVVDSYTVKLTMTDVPVDDAEPGNNDAAGATLLEVGKPQRRSLHSSTDLDWFKFTLDHRSEVTVSAAGYPGQMSVLTVYDSAMRQQGVSFQVGSNRLDFREENHLQPGTWYVLFSGGDRIRQYTLSLSVTPVLPPPVPTELTARPVFLQGGTPGVELRWKDGGSTETGFQVDRREGSGDWEELLRIEPNITFVGDAINVTLGKTYSYRIRALGRWEVHSEWSPPVTVTVSAPKPDLVGEWRSLTVTKRGRKKKVSYLLKGSFFLRNQGTAAAGASKVKLFVSLDNKPGGDLPLTVTVNKKKVPLELPLASLPAGQGRLLSTDVFGPIKLKKGAYAALKGKWLVAVLDSGRQVPEGEDGEKNNDVVSTPVP